MSPPLPYVSSVVMYFGSDEALNARTLASVARQSAGDLQVLLVARPDQVQAAQEAARSLREATAQEVGVLLLDEPVSAQGRNIAIALTLATFVCELPTGATLEPTMIEKCVWALETHPKAGVVIVDTPTEFQPIEEPGQLTGEAFRFRSISPGACVFRKRAWEGCNRLNESAPFGAVDRDMYIRMVEHRWDVLSVREALGSPWQGGSTGFGTISDSAEVSAKWLRSRHRLWYARAAVGGSLGHLLARAQKRFPLLGAPRLRIARKLVEEELTKPRQVLRHPVDSMLRAVPERFKGARWTAWGLPRRANAWVDVPPLLQLPRNSPVTPGPKLGHSPDQRTRVLLLHSQLIRGGAETVLLNVVTHLDHRRFEICIITTDTLPDQPVANPWARRFAEHTAAIYHLPSFLDRRWYLRFVVDFINSNNTDVVLISLSSFAYNSLDQLRNACPRPAIVDLLHAEAPYYPIDHIRLAASHRQNLDRRIVVSEALRAVQIAKYGEDPERVVVIGNGVDTDATFNPTRYNSGAFRRKLAISDGVAIVLWFGRVAIEKQLIHVVEVAERLRKRTDIVFILVGDGPEKPALAAAISERGLANVIMREAQDQIAEALAAADMVLFPSMREGLPMSGIEAMAMATPVIAARVPGWTDLISDGIDGFLVDDGDIGGYSDIVARLVDDPQLRARIGAAGRHTAVSAYDVRDFARSWGRLLREPRIGSPIR